MRINRSMRGVPEVVCLHRPWAALPPSRYALPKLVKAHYLNLRRAQAFKHFTSGGGGSGSGGGSQTQLISMAMGEASKLFDQHGGGGGGGKQDAVNGAAMTVTKLLVQSKFSSFMGGGNSGGLGQLAGLVGGGGNSGGGLGGLAGMVRCWVRFGLPMLMHMFRPASSCPS